VALDAGWITSFLERGGNKFAVGSNETTKHKKDLG